MATVIDTLFMELGIDSSKFSRKAKQAVSKLDDMTEAFEKAEAKTGKSGKGLDKHAEKVKQNVKQAKNLTEALGKVAKGAAALFALVTGSNALDKLIRETTEANVQLDNLSRNIGMSRNQLQAWGGMAEMAGGQADAMRGSLAGLSMSITRLTTMGDTSMVPFFNAFGVALLNADGKARNLDSIMLDLADRFSKMDRVQAYNLAKSMGLDDGTINTLLLGRAEMEKMLALQDRLYRSGEKEIAVSRELTRSRAYLNQQWDALKNMIADALAPHLLRLVKLVSSFADYLMRNENTMKHVFEGLAFVLGVVLIPVLWSAVTALYAFIAPFALAAAAVAALGAAFVLLYDDYKTWAEGGKSLFNWGAFTNYIKTSKVSVDSLTKGFTYLLTGYTSWSEAGKSLFDWLRLKGFIDENGVSLRSLANGFKSLANDIYQFVAPALEDLGEIFNALMNRDYNRAWTAAKRLAMRPVNFVAEQVQSAAERVSGAVDVATGHTPGAAGSAQAAVRSLGSGERVTKQMFSPGGTIYFGDSIADGYRSAVNGTGSTRVGANPQQVLGFINGYSGNLQGQTVILSSGMSNDPTDTDGIRAQIRALRAKGANVRLLGVSNTYNRKGQTGARMNALLGQIAREEHATFQGGFQAGRDNIHPANYSSQPWLGGGSRQAASGQLHRSRAFTPEKAAAIARVARNIGVSPNDLAAVISFETGGTFSPSITNPTSSATGLIQFMAGSGGTRGQYYGMTRDQFRSLSFDQQMNYVERYFKERGFDGRRQRNVADLYTAVTGYGYRRGTRAYELNKVWDSNGDGYIAKGEMVQNSAFRAHQRQYFPDLNQPIGGQAVADNAQRGLQSMQQGAVARQQAQQITNNSNMQFAINGGIHVQSSASTIDGTMADASAAARNRLVQIMPAMV
ncbi:SGNH/GDSL hydrolase family protein [Eikenella corrodens]|uniref:SGNH/GDSL hydrolase family protein n=1 Tax=Eikenella corrodens TaxID=539 RepID=UPI001C527A2D|nr:SGNH/GDSL hydrolase family protein [Eikenella corrodens]